MYKKTVKMLLGTALAASCVLPALAQKLPDVQELSFRAPEAIKIDGKITEWDKFQAYNKTTGISYLVSNDATNLYLVIQSTTSAATNKIMRGGITFTVNPQARKKEKEGFSVMFPVPAKDEMRSMMTSMSGMMGPNSRVNFNDPAKIQKMADSIMYDNNRKQIDRLKDIKVLGFKSITDSLLSIYNEEGIKARALFDIKGAYNYELAIPLSLMGMSADSPKEFTYNIKLNGLQLNFSMGEMRAAGGGGGGGGGGVTIRSVEMTSPPPGGGMRMGGAGGMGDFQNLISPTDFWGKYTLVK